MQRCGWKLTVFLCVIPLAVLAQARPAAAHFVWIDIVDDGGKPTARVMFGEVPSRARPGC